jgi:hypothetical protein
VSTSALAPKPSSLDVKLPLLPPWLAAHEDAFGVGGDQVAKACAAANWAASVSQKGLEAQAMKLTVQRQLRDRSLSNDR